MLPLLFILIPCLILAFLAGRWLDIKPSKRDQPTNLYSRRRHRR